MTDLQAMQAGFTAFTAGNDLSACPYRLDGADNAKAMSWLRGYDLARRHAKTEPDMADVVDSISQAMQDHIDQARTDPANTDTDVTAAELAKIVNEIATALYAAEDAADDDDTATAQQSIAAAHAAAAGVLDPDLVDAIEKLIDQADSMTSATAKEVGA